ncbi:glycerophosphoryl diester phosphodiesterase membrane domain-containing protein [Nocardioides sp. LML1-1-1.1]|uniref:glycerophosphoryl diester phosphodiesterase membrane domain-containing protein n=1 Tax=Nocardioides sp. LML1-1-1.1 TaxID=3135248 RepID=UPI00341822D8
MSEGPLYPPPGAPTPEEPAAGPPAQPAHPAYPAPGTTPPPAGWAPYPGAAGGPRPGLALGAAHKPGAFALRPLGLGDMYDGAFRIIRFNPKATVGAAVLVTAAAMVLPLLVTAVLSFTVGLALDESGEIETSASTSEVLAFLAAYGSLLLSLVLAQIGITLVTGMIVHVTRAAAVGRRLSLGEAWAATRGNRWRLIGLVTFLYVAFVVVLVVYVLLWVLVVALADGPWPVVVWGLVSVPAYLALTCWMWVRVYYLAVPALMIESAGVFGAIGRGWVLTRRAFWRTFGIALLTVVIANVAGSMLGFPFSLVGQLATVFTPEYALLALVLTQAVVSVVQNAFTAPFTGAVASMQYLDLRMRKEAYDVELLREAGIISE